MVQRLLAARNEARKPARALQQLDRDRCSSSRFSWSSARFCSFTTGRPETTPPSPPDRIYPQFIWNNLPPGIAGLVIAAILAAAMSNLSAALNSLASTTIMDFYKPLTTTLGVGQVRSTLPETRAARPRWLGEPFCSSSGLSRETGGRCWRRACPSRRSCTARCSASSCSACSPGESEIGAMAGMVASLLMMFYVKQYT